MQKCDAREIVLTRPRYAMSSRLSLIIRPLDLTDPQVCDDAWRLQRAAYEVEAALIGSRGMAALRETPAMLSANDAERFTGCWSLSEGAATLIGVSATEYDASSGWMISRLAVDPAFTRRGAGRALVAAMINRYGREGLSVSTGAANVPARRLYESLGFLLFDSPRAPDGTPLSFYRLQRGVGASDPDPGSSGPCSENDREV